MLTQQAQHALSELYAQACRITDTFELERIDRALDEIVRLNGSSSATFQVRSARGHAWQVLRDRRVAVPLIALESLQTRQESGEHEGRYTAVELIQWLRTTRALTANQKQLLFRLIQEEDTAVLAADYGLALSRMRERISRVRKVARRAYTSEVS
ncbi:hypothetical protein [Nonomuraea sp. NPDC001831]|uniref:hypothetical protein n=1 Tax=Nonomuraea sp. NPDC001831 TaxID=3364340 RepID=UPI0036A0C791